VAASLALAALSIALASGALVSRTELRWAERVKDPARDALPADAAQAEQVRLGYRIFLDTPTHAAGITAASLSCGSCHLNAGQKEGALPLVGVAHAYPEYNARAGRALSLEERIVGCFLRSLNSPGRRVASDRDHENAAPQPAADAPEIRALAAYLAWLSEGVAPEQTRAWRKQVIAKSALVPVSKLDPARGGRLFAERCATCHGLDGQGVDLGELKPGPLWGDRSWNDGAGAARVYTLAAFLRHAMPYTAPGTLTDEEAQQIAAFVTSQPRPSFPAKARDFLTEPLPGDAVYYRR
jgi:thiosulfate dehydrogenase